MKPMDKVALVGLGLIGSSLALALRRHGLAKEIWGTARTAATRETALRLGLCDRIVEDSREAAEGADMVVLCTPVGAFAGIMAQLASSLAPGAIVTDVGGAKSSMTAQLLPLVPEGRHLVPGHPIAGTEQSGPESGFAELFEDRWCILTPPPGTDDSAVERVRAIWQAMGSRVRLMTPDHHDQVLAVTSHLPHAISYTMVRVVDQVSAVSESEVIQYSASGFRDFTRIAASDPVMWRDIFLANREAILDSLGRFHEELFALQRAIRWGDADLLEEFLRRGREVRRGIVAAGQDAEGRPLFMARSGQAEGGGAVQTPECLDGERTAVQKQGESSDPARGTVNDDGLKGLEECDATQGEGHGT